MWGISDPGRLLKKKWDNAYELALELYSMATGEQPGGEATKPAATPEAARQSYRVERAHTDAPTQEQRRVIISAIQQAGKARQAAEDYVPMPQGTPGRVAGAVVNEARGVLNQISESVEAAIIGNVVDQSTDWIGKKASEILGVPPQRPGSPTSIPRLPLTGGTSVPAPPPTQPARQPQARPEPPTTIGAGAKHGTDSPLTGSVAAGGVTTSSIWDRNLSTGPTDVPHAPTDISFEPPPLNPVRSPDPAASLDEATDQPVYPTELTPKPMTPLQWANPKTKMVWLDTKVTAASGSYATSNLSPGTGHATFLDYWSDGTTFYPQVEPSPVWSMCQFPMQYMYALAHNIGEDWWVWPIGGVVTVQTQAGGLTAAGGSAPGSGVCNLMPIYQGSYFNIGTATVYNDMPSVVGAAGNVNVVCSVDAGGYLHALAEACS